MTHEEKPNWYPAKIGCWNCDDIYELSVKQGMLVPEFLFKEQIICRTCGCKTLRPFAEYKASKRIMSDILLHHEMGHMQKSRGGTEGQDDSYDHFQ